ncbi:MAG: alpha-1,2-fucosyltransferase [Lachnospiraceae bacterium]
MKVIKEYHPQGRMTEQTEASPLISVVVAVYNIETYVERCVRSIMSQTYTQLQILLVDDGSTDQSGVICDRMAKEDARIQVLHQSNGGLSDARNTGIAAAKGTYIAFVDGDDWIDAPMYERMLTAMLAYQADFAACRYRCIYPDRVVDDTTDRLVIFEGREVLECYIAEEDQIQIQNAAWNKLYRREIMQGLEFPVGKWYEDIVYTTKLLSKSKRSVYLDQAFYNYGLDRAGSIMSAGLGTRILTDLIPAYFEKTAFLQSIGENKLAAMHNYYIYKRLLLLYMQFRQMKDGSQRKNCRQIRTIIRSECSHFEEAYACKVANPNEKRKMSLFLLSPLLYRIVMYFNDKWIIPMKIKRHANMRDLIIVQMSGGLGNQMFQYALYRQLQEQGKDVKMDDVTCYGADQTRTNQLSVFSITYKTADREELVALTDAYMDPYSRIRRKLFGRRTYAYQEKQFNYDPFVFTLEKAYLEGCWQTERYFADVKDILKREFQFRVTLPQACETFLTQIQTTRSVSVHIRRGDYVQGAQSTIYGGICTQAYYMHAIALMQERYPDCHFYLFTNDYEWVRNNTQMQGACYTLVDCNDEENGYLDMLLMSRCQHNIIANSSFSWWAAWLNDNPDKYVIAPKKWLNGRDCSDIYTPGMLAI